MKYTLVEMFTLTCITALSAAFSINCPSPTYPSKFLAPFQSMAVFGDSFSDVGNIHILSNGTQPGRWSYDGRYSDGRVWEEYIQQFFGLPKLEPSLGGGTSYAYGGATVNNTYIHAHSTSLDANVPSVSDQIMQYITDENVLCEDRLHIVFAGYNDYWWYVYRNFTTSDGQDFNLTNIYTNVATDIVREMRILYDNGARIFLIGNIPNMSSWAEASLQTQEVLNIYDDLVNGHNRLLSSLLSDFEVQNNDATVYHLNAFCAFDCIDRQKDFFGIQDVVYPCHPSESDTCADIFSYKFWDYYHPTTHAHQIVSMTALESIYRGNTKDPKRIKHQQVKSFRKKDLKEE